MNPKTQINLVERSKELFGIAQPQDVESKPLLNLEDDTPLAPACDLSGEGSCEACQ